MLGTLLLFNPVQAEEDHRAFVIVDVFPVSLKALLILVVSIDCVASLAATLLNSAVVFDFLVKRKGFSGGIVVFLEILRNILKSRLIAIR